MVTETAVGAEMVARDTARLLDEEPHSHVTSACPAITNLIVKYNPWAVDKITPIVSPMIAHARYLKNVYGENSKVIFIGPCAAKKGEAEEPELQGIVDAVLTFEELRIWIEEENIKKDQLRAIDMDDIPASQARLFPLEGGLAKAASMHPDLLRQDFAVVSGSEEVYEMLDNLKSGSTIQLFEALLCPSGCINGPCFGDGRDVFYRRNRIIQHEKRTQKKSTELQILSAMEHVNLRREFSPHEIHMQEFSEQLIRETMAKTGKFSPEDELNCGACGYSSCRDKAIAVLTGMAEADMCIPWMRKVAERKALQIIDASPNAIVIVDSSMRIVEFNPSFAAIFSCTPGIIRKPLSTLMDPEDFEKVMARAIDRVTNKTVSYPNYHVSGSLNVYRLEDEELVVGILSNVNRSTEGLSRFDQIRDETLENAQQVIEKQMRMAQEIAGILGETTSETRILLHKLASLIKESEDVS